MTPGGASPNICQSSSTTRFYKQRRVEHRHGRVHDAVLHAEQRLRRTTSFMWVSKRRVLTSRSGRMEPGTPTIYHGPQPVLLPGRLEGGPLELRRPRLRRALGFWQPSGNDRDSPLAIRGCKSGGWRFSFAKRTRRREVRAGTWAQQLAATKISTALHGRRPLRSISAVTRGSDLQAC